MKIKIVLISCFYLFFNKIVVSQTSINSFKIIQNGEVPQSEINNYKTAISIANMEDYRYKSTNDTLEFSNGLKFVLLSARELYILDKKTNPSLYSEKVKGYLMPKFQLMPQGTLIALYSSNPNIKTTN